mgnify:FL=1
MKKYVWGLVVILLIIVVFGAYQLFKTGGPETLNQLGAIITFKPRYIRCGSACITDLRKAGITGKNLTNLLVKNPKVKGEKVNCVTPLEDINDDTKVNAIDVQVVTNSALGIDSNSCADVNNDNYINAVDVQIVINCALGIGTMGVCSAPPPVRISPPDFKITGLRIETIKGNTQHPNPFGSKIFLKIQDQNGTGGTVRVVTPSSYNYNCTGLNCKSPDITLVGSQSKEAVIDTSANYFCAAAGGLDKYQTFKIKANQTTDYDTTSLTVTCTPSAQSPYACTFTSSKGFRGNCEIK